LHVIIERSMHDTRRLIRIHEWNKQWIKDFRVLWLDDYTEVDGKVINLSITDESPGGIDMYPKILSHGNQVVCPFNRKFNFLN
jgi:hypothetical protein